MNYEITYDTFAKSHLRTRCIHYERAGGQCPRHAPAFRRPYIGFICKLLRLHSERHKVRTIVKLAAVLPYQSVVFRCGAGYSV